MTTKDNIIPKNKAIPISEAARMYVDSLGYIDNIPTKQQKEFEQSVKEWKK